MANKQKDKQLQRLRRVIRVRARIQGTATQPRLTVKRSLMHVYAQLIDDSAGKTIASATDLELKEKGKTKSELAMAVGELLAKKAKEAKVEKIVFDRGSYKFHGRIKALADGAKKGGLIF